MSFTKPKLNTPSCSVRKGYCRRREFSVPEPRDHAGPPLASGRS
jgi:hypothetical protein